MRTRPISNERRERGGGTHGRGVSGSVLIIVLWIAFGLVSLALYFANSMSMELRAADNQLASVQAEQTIEGAAVYVSNILAHLAQPNMLPQPINFKVEGVEVGEGTFWLIGRDTNDMDSTREADKPTFGLIDEASKVNLNGATNVSLVNLPLMTPNLLAAIYDWRTTNTQPSLGGAKSETYSTLNPPYLCKLTNYETVDELRMVYGMSLDLLYGEDANMNGILDANENDGMALPPNDNQDGRLDYGFLEFLTVSTHEPTNFGPTNRVLVTDTTAVENLLSTNFSSQSAKIMANFAATPPTSVLDFYTRSGMSESDFITIEPMLMNSNTVGQINVNTASATVLGCIPGLSNNAASLISFRQGNSGRLNSVAWVKDAMAGNTNYLKQAGPWITSHSFQFTADIAAVGHHGRGYRRVKFIFDISSGVPQIIYRQDLTHLGWALGRKIHDQLIAQDIR